MAWPNSQQRRVSLTIQASRVDALLTDFPVRITRDCLPNEICSPTDASRAQSDGGDLRFASDADGNTQLAFEVVNWEYDTSDAAGDADIEIFVKVPSSSPSVNTPFYCGYNTAGTTSLPAASDSNGSENVWDSNFVGVWHVHEDPSVAFMQFLDSSANGNHFSPAGGMTSDDSVAGAIAGRALDLDDVDDFLFQSSDASLQITGAHTIEALAKPSKVNSTNEEGLLAKWTNGANRRSYQLAQRLDAVRFAVSSSGSAGAVVSIEGPNALSTSSFSYVSAAFDPSTRMDIRANGTELVSLTTGVPAAAHSNNAALWMGQTGTSIASTRYGGVLDEVRLSKTNRSNAWRDATYETLLNPGLFLVEGAPEDIAGGTTVNLAGVSGTSALGSIALQIDTLVVPAGVAGTGQLGTLVVSTGAGTTVALTGVSGTGQLGAFGVQIDASFQIEGVSAAGIVGTLTVTVPADANVSLTGVPGTGGVGDVTLLISGVWNQQTEETGIWTLQPGATTTWTEQ